MPLSEDEQRILRQIEHELRSDPTFSARGSRMSGARLIWLGLAVVGGVVATVAALTLHPFVAFVAFVIVLAIGIVFEREARAVGRERLGDLPVNAWLSGVYRRSEGSHDDRRDIGDLDD